MAYRVFHDLKGFQFACHISLKQSCKLNNCEGFFNGLTAKPSNTTKEPSLCRGFDLNITKRGSVMIRNSVSTLATKSSTYSGSSMETAVGKSVMCFELNSLVTARNNNGLQATPNGRQLDV
ncbi:hypothetical protein TNCT_35581 [Trichonephila clavata]|uniref:Uncharacterized protein n=1 Tax=Trichonephila clavata TaxID=2740835 RepID=A0A8X6FQJ9_TRICU|nr:hypothetical protein TNCT_35581 [Trichonephila clavata]